MMRVQNELDETKIIMVIISQYSIPYICVM